MWYSPYQRVPRLVFWPDLANVEFPRPRTRHGCGLADSPGITPRRPFSGVASPARSNSRLLPHGAGQTKPRPPRLPCLSIVLWPTAMAPLTRCRADNPGRVPAPLMTENYVQRASVGFIISEATAVDSMAVGYRSPGCRSRSRWVARAETSRCSHFFRDSAESAGPE